MWVQKSVFSVSELTGSMLICLRNMRVLVGKGNLLNSYIVPIWESDLVCYVRFCH